MRVNTEECWLYAYPLNSFGYATARVSIKGKYKNFRLHRVMYENIIGPIPEGLVLDHLCSIRHCINPAHLEPVTQYENMMRADTLFTRKKSQTHCKYGHLLSGDNLYLTSKGQRQCKTCRARRVVERRKHIKLQ